MTWEILERMETRQCNACSASYTAFRSDQRWCSSTCANRYYARRSYQRRKLQDEAASAISGEQLKTVPPNGDVASTTTQGGGDIINGRANRG